MIYLVVAARSKNMNSFGLRGYVFMDTHGHTFEAASGYMNHYPGDRIQVYEASTNALATAGYEIPRQLKLAPPNIVKEVWRKAPPQRGTCSQCKREVLLEELSDGKCSCCVPAPTADSWDELGFIMAWESGETDDEQLIVGFQHLIDNGHAWSLQGMYGRMATALIERGFCHR